MAQDGRSIDDAHLPYVVNPFDAIALEEAIHISEQSDGVEVLAVGIGGGEYEQELRTALAMGADRALLVDCCDANGNAPELDSWNVACLLEAVVRNEQPDLVLMGKQAVDDDANQAGQFLAARLGWPQATFASRLEILDQQVRVARETDAGIETILVQQPSVITTDLRLNEPRYASLPSILKARQKTIEQITLSELGISLAPRVELLELEELSSGRTCQMLDSVDQFSELIQQNATGSTTD